MNDDESSLSRFKHYFEHQESIEAYEEIVYRVRKTIAFMLAPVIMHQLGK